MCVQKSIWPHACLQGQQKGTHCKGEEEPKEESGANEKCITRKRFKDQPIHWMEAPRKLFKLKILKIVNNILVSLKKNEVMVHSFGMRGSDNYKSYLSLKAADCSSRLMGQHLFLLQKERERRHHPNLYFLPTVSSGSIYNCCVFSVASVSVQYIKKSSLLHMHISIYVGVT